jgi:apolipoprotein D and lipocalin family protein
MKQAYKRLATIASVAAIVAGSMLLAAPAWVLAQQAGVTDAGPTISTVELSRYVGRWYEIARFPNSFEEKCVGHATADYRILPDDAIEVVNRCRTASGDIDLAVGEARVIDKNTNAKLQVRFAPSWLSWLPWVWSDYWILELDDAYSVATVGSPNRDTLWILARTPTIPEADYERWVDNATKKGFDTSRLVKTQQ